MGGRAQAVVVVLVVVLVLERLARLSGVFLPAASGGSRFGTRLMTSRY